MKEFEILEKAYNKAQANTQSKSFADVDYLIEKIDGNKSVITAITTSLLKKIISPEQDSRLPTVNFTGGYSARDLDKKFVSPFFKQRFPKYANKESAFLTRSLVAHKWEKNNFDKITIRGKKRRESFLNIFEMIEVKQQNPNEILVYLFAKLIELSKADEAIFGIVNTQKTKVVNINSIVEMLQKYFVIKQSSRLPVVAIYSIYEILLPKFERFKNKKLLPLQVHTSSDKHGFGDIEIYDADDKPFEIIEIKHNIPIDRLLIFDVVKKTQTVKINRYYVLTTFPNCFTDLESEKSVVEYIANIKQEKNVDIIANGIIATIKYYLRFVDDYSFFIETYTKNLVTDAKSSTEIKNFHLVKWAEILESYK